LWEAYENTQIYCVGSTVECKQVVQLGTAGLQGVHSTLNGVGG